MPKHDESLPYERLRRMEAPTWWDTTGEDDPVTFAQE